jgi:hypothetical protein
MHPWVPMFRTFGKPARKSSRRAEHLEDTAKQIARGELEALRDTDDVMMTNCLVMTRRIAGKLAGRPADRMVAMYPWISMSLMFLGRRGTRVASHLSTIQSLLQSKSGQGRSCRLTASHEAQNKPAIWRHWRGYKR